MLKFALVSLLVLLQLGQAHSENQDDLPLVIIAVRHGFRNPFKLMPLDPQRGDWAWEGEGELNNEGKKEAYSLGEFLRRRYSQAIPQEYSPKEFRVISSSKIRAQMTAQLVMAGMFPPSGRSTWNSNLNWQPVQMFLNDTLLNIRGADCPQYALARKAIEDGPVAAALLNEDRTLVNYLAEKSGFNATIKGMADVADNILAMKRLQVPLPIWLTSPNLPNHTSETIQAAIMKKFLLLPQRLCTQDDQCKRLTGSYFLHDILRTMKTKAAGQNESLKAVIYSTHFEHLVSAMQLLGFGYSGAFVNTSGGFMLEYREQPTRSIRAMTQNPASGERKSKVVVLEGCEQEWCDLDNLLMKAEAKSESNWKKMCRVKQQC